MQTVIDLKGVMIVFADYRLIVIEVVETEIMLTSWLTDGWSPLTFWRALLAGAVGVRASEGIAP